MSNSISELMDKHPMLLTQDELTEIIKHYRSTRVAFVTTSRRVPNAAAAKKVIKAEALATKLGIDMGKIEL